MKIIKVIRWALFILAVGTIVAYPLFKRDYQASQVGWTTYFPSDTLDCDFRNSGIDIFLDGRQNIWLLGSDCFRDTAQVFDGVSWTGLKISGLSDDRYEIDNRNQLWRIRENQLIEIGKFEAGKWSSYVTVKKELLDDRFGQTVGFTIDDQGQIWIAYGFFSESGEWMTGVSVFDGTAWKTFNDTTTPTLVIEHAFGPILDGQNQVWLWTEESGFRLFDGEDWTSFSAEDLNLDAYGPVISFALVADGNPWLATDNYLISVEGDQVIDLTPGYDTYACGLVCGDNLHFAFDSGGNVWVANSNKLSVGAVVNSDEIFWTGYTAENSGLSVGDIQNLVIDGTGNIWVVTESGINVFNPDEAELSPLKQNKLWNWLNLDKSVVIDKYWVVPLFLFLSGFALLYIKVQPGRKTNPLAIVSLSLGILGVFLSPLLFLSLNNFAYELGGKLEDLMNWYWGSPGIVISMIFNLASVTTGVISIRRGKAQRGAAIAGIVLSILTSLSSSLFLIGRLMGVIG